MVVVASDNMVSAFADTFPFEREAPFQAIQINAASPLEIDCWVCHFKLLLL